MPGITERALLEGHTLQTLGEGPLLAFPGGRAPEGLLRALEALFLAAMGQYWSRRRRSPPAYRAAISTMTWT